jgi:hypothetical protein
VEQIRDLMDKKQVRGLPGRTSGHMIAKSISIKDQGGKPDRCAEKVRELTTGGPACHELQGFSRGHSRRIQAGLGRKSYEAEGLNGKESEQA